MGGLAPRCADVCLASTGHQADAVVALICGHRGQTSAKDGLECGSAEVGLTLEQACSLNLG